MALGSFGNVVISRLPRGGSLVSPGSSCPRCGLAIAPWHNVPVLSYVWLRGRCAACGWKIPSRYLATELLTPAVACLAYLSYPDPLQAFSVFCLVYVLLLLTVIDFESFLLPDALTYPLALAGLLRASLTQGEGSPFSSGLGPGLAGMALCGGLVLILAAAYPGGLGLGDVKMASALGAWFGPLMGIQCLLAGFVAGGIVAALLLLTGRKKAKDRIAFGPFLALGAIAQLVLTAQDIVLQ